jgi:vacuolar-type H+-ATPase subunit I/STV1
MIVELLVIFVMIALMSYVAIRWHYLPRKQNQTMGSNNQNNSVRIVANVWIVTSIIMGLGALLTVIAGFVLDDINVPESSADTLGLSLIQLILAIGSLITAVNFRLRKPWSRWALEAASWLVLLHGIASTVYVFNALDAPPQASTAILLFCVLLIVALVASIVYLRSAETRKFFKPTTLLKSSD